MREIKVTNCQECPFCNSDNEYGYDRCNLDIDIHVDNRGWDSMPKDKVHDKCPLKIEVIKINI